MTEMKNQTKVFIAGSRRLSRLNPNVRRRIDNIVEKGFTVLVGDANGVDKSVQRYLSSRSYTRVIVFCMEGGCRNNVGDWPTRMIAPANSVRRDFAYYSTKDRAMVEEADYGLMLWDGRSRGTLTNIVHLVREGKPVVVYIASDKASYTLRQAGHLAEMLKHLDPAAFHRIDRDLQLVESGVRARRRVDPAPLF